AYSVEGANQLFKFVEVEVVKKPHAEVFAKGVYEEAVASDLLYQSRAIDNWIERDGEIRLGEDGWIHFGVRVPCLHSSDDVSTKVAGSLEVKSSQPALDIVCSSRCDSQGCLACRSSPTLLLSDVG